MKSVVSEVREHIGRWVMVALTTIAVGSAIGGGWFYFHDEQQRNIRWYADDEQWNAAIIERQTRIEDELSSLRVLVEEVLRETDELEDDHKRVVQAIHQGLVDINYRIGEHQGAHE